MIEQTVAPSTLRILVIDDEPFVQAVTIHLLRQLGYQQIESAGNGADALQVLQNSPAPFDLIICDLNMPVMNGFDFMRGAQAINYAGALIVLSSEAQHTLNAALAFGAACGLEMLGALRKPLDRERLFEILARYENRNG